MTDPLGNIITMTYDENGRMVSRMLPEGQKETFDYDPAGRLVEHINFNGRRTEYGYDEVGHLVSKTFEDGTIVEYDYNTEGQRTGAGDQTFEYDERGRIDRVITGLGDTIGIEYDPVGNRRSVTTSGGTVEYEYDALNRLSKVTDFDGGETRYFYDAAGNVRQVVYPNNVSTAYEYDARNRLTGVVSSNLDTGEVLAAYAYTLNALGLRTSVVEDSGRTVDYEYDDAHRLIREQVNDPVTGALTIEYVYDAAGNRTRMIATSPSRVAEITYLYDDNNRLEGASQTLTITGAPVTPDGRHFAGPDPRPSTASAIFYGGFGGFGGAALLTPLALLLLRARRYASRDGRRRYGRDSIALIAVMLMLFGPETVARAHTTVLQDLGKGGVLAEMQEPVLTTYTYDDNGNLIESDDGTTVTRFEYNDENRLTSVTRGSDVTAYTYDALGQRTSRTSNGITTEYVVDNATSPTQVLVERTNGDEVYFVYGGPGGDSLISMHRPGGTAYYLFDGHTSTRNLTNAAGEVTDSYDYDAFGNLLASSGATSNDRLYAGERHDAATGFYHLRNRDMDPAVGRFIQKDPFPGDKMVPGSLHPYTYVHNNPVNAVDPHGLFFSMISVMISVAIQHGLSAFRAGSGVFQLCQFRGFAEVFRVR